MLAGLCSASISTIFRETNLFLQQYIRCQSKKINRLSKKRDCHILHDGISGRWRFFGQPLHFSLAQINGNRADTFAPLPLPPQHG